MPTQRSVIASALVDDPAVLAEFGVHCRQWTPAAEQYTHLGRMQVDNEPNPEQIADGPAAYMRDAMAA